MAATLESLALLRAVRQLDAEGGLSDMELEEVRASLKGGREVLANLLAYPPRKAEDRAAVRGMTVEVRGGQSVRLGALDVDNALILRCVSRSTRSRGRRVARRSSRDAASRARDGPSRGSARSARRPAVPPFFKPPRARSSDPDADPGPPSGSPPDARHAPSRALFSPRSPPPPRLDPPPDVPPPARLLPPRRSAATPWI